MKGMYPVAEFVHQCRERAVKVVQEMERNGKVAAASFKPVERLRVPEDYDSLVTMMLDSTVRATASRLKQVTDELVRKRNWFWCLMHPELDEHIMHPSRSMCLPSAWSCGILAKGG